MFAFAWPFLFLSITCSITFAECVHNMLWVIQKKKVNWHKHHGRSCSRCYLKTNRREVEKVGFNRALKVQDAEKRRSCKPQEVEIVERDVSTHWSRGYVRKHKNLSKKREVYSLVMIPMAKAHTENSCQWLHSMGLSMGKNSAWVLPVPLIYVMSSYLRGWPRSDRCRRCRCQRVIGTCCRAWDGWSLLRWRRRLCNTERTRVAEWTQRVSKALSTEWSLFLKGLPSHRNPQAWQALLVIYSLFLFILVINNSDAVTGAIYCPLSARSHSYITSTDHKNQYIIVSTLQVSKVGHREDKKNP